MLRNDFLSKKLKKTEHQNKIDILNLNNSTSRLRNLTLSNQTNSPASKHQQTCCDTFYELLDKYSLVNLYKICDKIPTDIQCMKKCLEIDEDKQIEFNLEVDGKIEEWIEHRLIFEEVYCVKIRKEINLHSKQTLHQIVPTDEKSESSGDRLSKDDAFNLIKTISTNLGLNQLNSFEHEFISNDQKSNKIIVNKRGIEIIQKLRLLTKLLSQENKFKNVNGRNLNNQLNKHPANQFQNTFNQNHLNHPFNYQQNSILKYESNRREEKSIKDEIKDEIKEDESKDLNQEEIDSFIFNPINSIESYPNYQCVQIKLNQSAIDYLLKNYPNITIINMNDENLKNFNNLIDNDKDKNIKTKSIENQLKTRGIFSILGLDKAQNTVSKDGHITTKLIQQLSSSKSHEEITNLAIEVLKNHSADCQQDYTPNLSSLLSLNLRLKKLTNDFNREKTNEIIELCNQLVQIVGKLNYQYTNCDQSIEIDYMIIHVLNETSQSSKYCLNIQNIDLIDQTHHSAESAHHLDHIELNATEINQINKLSQLNISEIDQQLIECLNWSKVKSCQNNFIPLFELIEADKIKQLFDNKSNSLNELRLFKDNLTELNGQSILSSANCKDVLLFENCIKQDLEDTISLDLKTGKLIELNSNSTCEFGTLKLNRNTLTNALINKITNQISEQMSFHCPSLNSILNLVRNSDKKEDHSKNLIQFYSKKYTGVCLCKL